MSPGADLSEAAALLEARRYPEALAACRAALAAAPGDMDGEHLLGRILCEAGRPDFAALMLQRVLAHRPDDPAVLLSVGRAQRLAGDVSEARGTLERAVELGSEPARIELAAALIDAGEPEAALGVLPADGGEAHYARANALHAAGRDDDARAALGAAIDLDAAYARRHLTDALGLRARGDEERALRLLAAGAALRPEDPELRYLAAASRGELDGRTPDDYLRGYFDRFASGFDEQLATLGYRAYEDLIALVAARVADGADVLDAGCGTGLCGPGLRPLARRLEGVDISGGMLERARERGVYDALHEQELTAFLAGRVAAYDVVVAADVLIYFADLGEALGPMTAALRPGGVLAFSVETHEGAGRELRKSGRWAHGEDEVRAATPLALELTEVVLRTEFGEPVRGLLAVGQA